MAASGMVSPLRWVAAVATRAHQAASNVFLAQKDAVDGEVTKGLQQLYQCFHAATRVCVEEKDAADELRRVDLPCSFHAATHVCVAKKDAVDGEVAKALKQLYQWFHLMSMQGRMN
eukprot:gene26204-11933_t